MRPLQHIKRLQYLAVMTAITSSHAVELKPRIEYCEFGQTNNTFPIAAYFPEDTSYPTNVIITVNSNVALQYMEGIGGTFNEIGGEALTQLDPDLRQRVISALFDKNTGAGFSFCRTPLGANDFALSAYSLNDSIDDYEMSRFNIDRDREYLIPYIQAAIAVNPNLRLHASPWSPPGWLKDNGSMTGGGRLKNEPDVYHAYALYVRKYLQAYASEGIHIDRLFVQNEPNVEMEYPSCRMDPTQMTQFVIDYLTPEFKRANIQSEIWAGPFQEDTDLFAHSCYDNATFRHAVSGAGFQYSDPQKIRNLKLEHPRLGIMHTESRCFNSANTVEQAKHLFYELHAYWEAGCTTFTYWNMILNEKEKSTWGWSQNSLITIHRKSQGVTLNPDFAVMALMSRWVRPGCRRYHVSATSGEPVLAFRDSDGPFVIFLWTSITSHSYALNIDGADVIFNLPTNTLCAIIMDQTKSGKKLSAQKW